MHKFCPQDKQPHTVTALRDVKIFSKTDGYRVSFQLEYKTESLFCIRNDHFRCSDYSCIPKYQTCDGVTNCENGDDETDCEKKIIDVKGVNVSRANTIAWLKDQRLSYGFGKNTPRVIIALYLSGEINFYENSLKEELTAQQLELQTLVALLRNSTDPLSINELSMLIKALFLTCHNPRQFYGHDLLQILGERVTTSKHLSPGAYLTLCNANWTFAESQVEKLMELLQTSEYPFYLDIHAMTLMALTCIKNKTDVFEIALNASERYDAAIEKLIHGQQPDGSFGNVYTTALVTQALLSSGRENKWNLTSTLEYLMDKLSYSTDMLSAYLVLPILSGKSLIDMVHVNCTVHRKHREDDEISDVTNKLGGSMHVQYSLFIGDRKDIIHTIYLRIPENGSAYDIMRVAQVADTKYKFLHKEMPDYIYVYEIAGIVNDPEAGKFWVLYIEDNENGIFMHHITSPDKLTLKEGEHFIMWYKTVNLGGKDE